MKKISKKRKKLGKVKDLFEKMGDNWGEFEHFINYTIKNKKGNK